MKLNKKIQVISISVLIISLIFVAFIFVREIGISKPNDVYKIDGANISKIQVNAANANVLVYDELMGEDNHEIRIICNQIRKNFDITTNDKNKTLLIKQKSDTEGSLSITIYVQTNYKGEFDINTGTGNVYIDPLVSLRLNCNVNNSEINQ